MRVDGYMCVGVCYKDKVGVAGSTARAMNKHVNVPMHARQEMLTHVEPTRTRRPITAWQTPTEHAAHPCTRPLSSPKHPQPRALTGVGMCT